MRTWSPEPELPPAGRRGRSRLRVRLAARLETLSETANVILHDISLTGARVSAPPGARAGQDCVLMWDGHESFGRIVWVRGGMCGLFFDEVVPPAVLIATRDHNDKSALPEDRDLRREAARRFSSGVSRF